MVAVASMSVWLVLAGLATPTVAMTSDGITVAAIRWDAW
jgi:hypothetical protein